MCKALEELKRRNTDWNYGYYQNLQKFQISKAATIENIMHEFSLPEDAAIEYVEKY